MTPRRVPGKRPVTVDFDLIDGLARVDGELETPEPLSRIAALARDLDRMKSERDRRWPRPARADPDWQDADTEIRRLSARIARARRDCLHVWTTRIVQRASDLTIHSPRISEHTSTPRGDEREWGAHTSTVSELNRSVLSYAPAMAVQMLSYKAEEAGIRCDVVIDEAPAIAIGAAMVQAGQDLRRTLASLALTRRAGDSTYPTYHLTKRSQNHGYQQTARDRTPDGAA
jgi:transposase